MIEFVEFFIKIVIDFTKIVFKNTNTEENRYSNRSLFLVNITKREGCRFASFPYFISSAFFYAL